MTILHWVQSIPLQASPAGLRSRLALSCLCAELFTPIGATVIQDATSTNRGHTRTKTMAPLADQIAGLICALHCSLRLNSVQAAGRLTHRVA